MYKSEFYIALDEALQKLCNDESYIGRKLELAMSKYDSYLEYGYGEEKSIRKVLFNLFDEDIECYVLNILKIKKIIK